MAKPRVFVSSTYYDLKNVRASLDEFVRGLGYESVLSEKGDIAYAYDRPLDESCYVEVSNADILVLIVGGRYGAAASEQETGEDSDQFYERYESITKREFERAIELDIPSYILVDRAVYDEYQTFLLNRDSQGVSYAHVDSVNVFLLLDGILKLPRNNPLHPFERYAEIEEWLRDQWAGLFRDLLTRSGQQKQMSSLAEQVGEMAEINTTLKNYMQAIISSVAPDRAETVISEEERSLTERQTRIRAKNTPVIEFLRRSGGIPADDAIDHVLRASSIRNLLQRLSTGGDETPDRAFVEHAELLMGDDGSGFLEDLNEIREMFGVRPLRRPPPPQVRSTGG